MFPYIERFLRVGVYVLARSICVELLGLTGTPLGLALRSILVPFTHVENKGLPLSRTAGSRSSV